MVLQCKDCKIWFRTQSKFDNHKNGSLGLSCSGNRDSFKTGPENDDISVNTDEKKLMPTESQNLQTFENFHNRNYVDRALEKNVCETPTNAAQDDDNPELCGESENGNNSETPISEPAVNINTNNEARSPTGIKITSVEEVSSSETKRSNSSADGNTVQDCSISSTDNSIILSDDESFSDEESDHFPSAGISEDPRLVCVHLDTLSLRLAGERRREEPRISQLGCTTALTAGPSQTFFAPIKPAGLEHFLANYKMEGDLLKALHITQEENGQFEFRAQFEIKRKEKNKIYCSTEEEATENLRNYLKQFKNIVLFGIDRETLTTFLKKVNWDQSLSVQGILTWSDVLSFSTKYLGDLYKNDLDLEDFYTEYCGKVAGYINTLDVSVFLQRSIKKLYHEYTRKLSQNVREVRFSWYEIFQDIVQSADLGTGEKEPGAGTTDFLSQPSLEVEVYSSFRPAVATKIALEKMETVQLSSGSDSDSDIGVIQEKIVKKYSRRKMILRQRLRSTFETIRKRKSELRRPSAKMPRLVRDGPIMITSDSGSDSELTQTKLEKVAENLSKRNCSLTVYPQLPRRNRRLGLGRRSASLVPNCSICNIEFGDMAALNQHVRQFHLKCGPCNRQFSELALALRHKSLHQEQLVNTDILLQEENDYIFGC